MAKRKQKQKLKDLVNKYGGGESNRDDKVKSRNFVSKNSRDMAGAGAHEDKKGEKAPRARQKRNWKKEAMNENRRPVIDRNSIDAYDDEAQAMMKKAGQTGDRVDMTHLQQAEVREMSDQLVKIGTNQHGIDMYQNREDPSKFYIVTDSAIYNESLITSANDTLLYESSSNFDQAIADIENEFGINLSEGFSAQQNSDMQKLIGEYGNSFFRDDTAEKVGNDLEQLEYQPEEIDAMVPHIMSAVETMWREQSK